MKTNSTSRAAFFNSRLLIGFALCSVGVLLALAGLSDSVTGSAPDILNGHCAVNNMNLTGYCIAFSGCCDTFCLHHHCTSSYNPTACPVGAIVEYRGTITCYNYNCINHSFGYWDLARSCTVGGPSPTPTPTASPPATPTPTPTNW